jgi:hypothetical protein
MPPLLITNANADEQVRIHRARLNGHELYGWQGCRPRIKPYGCIQGVQPASFLFPRIPRDKWRELITAGAGRSLGDLTKGVLPPHDQGRTNYCWAHGTVRAVEALRVYQLQKPELLSAESVAVPVTGGINRGGSPDEALDRIMSAGACEQSYWPLNDLNERHAKTGWLLNALDHVILRWADIENFDDQATLALHRIPAAIGLGWWMHLVCQLDLVYLDDIPAFDHIVRATGKFGLACDNSWGADYGDNGRFYLDEKHATADLGGFAPISATFDD